VKILITTEQYYPIKSGVASVVTSIAEELVNRGHQVYVTTSFQHRDKRIYNGVHIKEFKIYGGFGNYYRGEIEEYIRFVVDFDCDVMINECVQTWPTDLILDHLKDIKAKKVLHSHGFSLLSYKTRNPWAYIKAKFYYSKLYKYLREYHHIFLLHEKTVETPYLRKHNIQNFSYVPNGIDDNFIINDNQIEKKEKYIINISNYFPQKNQEFLMEAYYQSGTSYKLIMIGSSVLKNYLDRLKRLKIQFDKKYGFKEVEFFLDIPRERTVEYLEGATLFLHSSLLEVFPVVIIESMAKGVPFVSTDVGNISDLSGGRVVQNVDEMAREIEAITNNKIIYDKMVLDALKLIKTDLNWSKIVEKLDKVLHELK